MPNIIKIFLAVQNYMPLIRFWKFCLGKAIYIKRTGIKQYHCLDLVNIHLLAKIIKISQVVWKLNFISVSENFALVRLFIKKSGIKQYHCLDLVKIYLSKYSKWLGLVIFYLYTKNYQNIPSGLKVIHHIQFLKILPRWGFLQESTWPRFCTPPSYCWGEH